MSSKRKRGKTLILDAEATEVFLDVFEALDKERTKKIIRKVKKLRKDRKRRIRTIPAGVLKVSEVTVSESDSTEISSEGGSKK